MYWYEAALNEYKLSRWESCEQYCQKGIKILEAAATLNSFKYAIDHGIEMHQSNLLRFYTLGLHSLYKARYYQKTKDYCQKALSVEIIRSLDPEVVAEIHLIMAESYDEIGNSVETRKHILEGIRLLQDSPNSTLYLDLSTAWGLYTWREQSDVMEAIDILNKVLEKAEKLKISDNLQHIRAKALNDLGLIYFQLGEYIKAKDAFEESNEIDKNLHRDMSYAAGLNNLAFNLIDIGDIDDALKYAREAKKIAERIHDYDGLAYSLGIIGSIQVERENNSRAIINLKKAIDISEKIKTYSVITYWFFNLARAYIKINRFDDALTAAQDALKGAPYELEEGYWTLDHWLRQPIFR